MVNTKKINVTKHFHFPWGAMIRFSALYLVALAVIHGLVYCGIWTYSVLSF